MRLMQQLNNRSARPHGMACLIAALCVSFVTSHAFAIHPQTWLHNTEADFESGEIENVVITNLGDLKLATSNVTIGEFPDKANIVYDIESMADGTMFIASGPEAKLLKRMGDKVEQVLELPDEQVFALGTFDGKLLLAISGATSRLAVLDGDKLLQVVHLKAVRYIWDVLVDGRDIYLATGTEGMLLKVAVPAGQAFELLDEAREREAAEAKAKAEAEATVEEAAEAAAEAMAEAAEATADAADGASNAAAATATEEEPADDDEPEAVELPDNVTLLLDTTQANLLCVGRDGMGRLYVGTDTDGLVYRVTPKAGGVAEAFVIYDAAEPEIGALVVTQTGVVYAGTADANQARPGRLTAAATAEQGRPAEGPGPDSLPDAGDLPNVPDKPGDMGEAPAEGEGAATEPEATMPNGDAEPADAAEGEMPAPGDGVGEGLGEVAPSKPAVPTAEQRETLREEIRKRLLAARQSGRMQVSSGAAASPTSSRSVASRTRGGGGAGASQPAKQGNAVYRIDADGFVTEVFRESVMVLKLILEDGNLYIATGNEGQIYRVDSEKEETTILVDLDAKQIPAMMRGPDGLIVVGTANPASLVRLTQGYAEEGTFLSPAMDAAQISLWGNLYVTGDVPTGTRMSIETRSGNVDDPEKAPWSAWSAPVVFEHDAGQAALEPRLVPVSSPPARFLQYRAKMFGAAEATPVIDNVEIAYVLPNLRPQIQSIIAVYPGEQPRGARPRPGGNPAAQAQVTKQTKLNITWQAADANQDTLSYTLEYQRAGTKVWLPLIEDEATNKYEWDTLRVPDGRYLIRVTASDRADNTADTARTATRQSEPVVVDNTNPGFEGLETNVARDNGKSVVTMKGKAVDGLSRIVSVHYAVDSVDSWQAALPDDMIYDSTSEAFTVKIRGLSPGQHILTVRAVDDRDNAVHEAAVVEVK